MNPKTTQKWMQEFNEKPMSAKAPIYLYATEMVSTYYSKLSVKGKVVLTICGSGDQVLNALFMGAKKIVAFDINKQSEYITQLKIAAIQHLPYAKFLSFFGDEKKKGNFVYVQYKKIRKSLNKKTARFFDSLYTKFNKNGKQLIISSHIRHRDTFSNHRIKQINSYLKNEKNYLALRERLQAFALAFIQSDIQKIAFHPKIKNEKFDLINMSNVPGYITVGMEKQGHLDPCGYLAKEILVPLQKILSPRGKAFYYIFSPTIYAKGIVRERSPAAHLSNFKNFKHSFRISESKFQGIIQGTFDKIVIFKK